MAFNVKQIQPNDLRPRVAIGVEIPFKGKGVFTPNYKTKDAVKNNLINFFLTDPGERFGNPLFGAGIRKFIFEQITNDNIEFIREDIQTKLSNAFPLIAVSFVKINTNPNNNSINIIISYSVVNTNITDQIDLTFK